MVRHFSRLKVYLFSLLMISTLLVAPQTSTPTRADTAAPAVIDNVEEWAIGSGLLYWANSCFSDEFNPFAVLKRRPTNGGTERTIESIEDYGRCLTYASLLSSGDGLYYFDLSQSQISRMPLSEPYTPQLVKALTNNQQPSNVFVEANGYLYWLNGLNTIYRTRKDGSGEIETVVSTAASPSALLVVGSTVYWGDSTGIWTISVNCETLPCAASKSQFSNLGGNARPYGLVYQALGGFQGSYRVYWVEQVASGPNNSYQIRYRACSAIAICFVLPPEGQVADPPPSFYASTVNWRIGNPLLTGGSLYWTEADYNTVTNANGDLKRKASTTTTPGAETIATGQAKIDYQLFVDNGKIFFSRQSVGIYSLSLNASAITRDFRVEGMEVTQAIQNLANDAPLVADKTTYVRAYAKQIAGPSTPNVEARLVGLRNGVALPGSPLQPVNGVRALANGGSFDRARLNDGWYFLLPSNWIGVGDVTLRVEIDARQIHSDPDRSNNQISQTLNFQKAPPICVIAVPVRTHTPLPSVYDPNFSSMVSHFERRWPTPAVWIFRDSDPVEELQFCSYYGIPYPCHGPYELSDGWGLTNGMPDRDKVIASLWGRALLSYNPDACDDIGAPVHFMGMVHPLADNGGASGYASTVSNQSWVQLPRHTPNPALSGWDQLRAGSVMAQELAHNYGRKHVNCGNPDNIDSSYPYPPCQIANTGASSYYGFDVTTLQPIRPDQTADFMSYSSRSWVSDYTWRALLSSIKANQLSSVRMAARPQAAPAQGESVFVTGLVDAENHRGAISVLLVLPTGTLPPTTLRMLSAQAARPAHNDAGQAIYSLRLLDKDGGVLAERALTLTALDDHSAESASALFSDLFPQPSGQVALIELLADGAVVDTRSVGSTAPTIAIQQPVGGAQIADQLTIEWTASDADVDDRLLFTVQYSHDAGASWHTLALNRPGSPEPSNSLSLSNLGALHGSAANSALIRILASDGYNTSIATSQPFTLKDRLPEPLISAPEAGQTIAAGQAVALSGGAIDAEDGGLAAAALSWQIDGLSQGSGSDLAAAGLAPGAHIATLSATDSQGQAATATASFSVAPLNVGLAAAPALDGLCDDGSYAEGSSLGLKPYSDGSQASVRLLRSADYLWACFSGLQPGAASPGAFVGLRADNDNSRDQQAQPSDKGFFVGEDGAVFSQVGDGAGGFNGSGSSGVQGQVAAAAGFWSAELRIEAAQLGGWDHLVGLSVGHYQLATAGDSYTWPYTALGSQPSSWATTALGSQPLLSAIEPQVTTAGSPAFSLAVTGSGFISGTVVLWNGVALPTSFVDSAQLSAQVGAELLNSAAVVQITTRSPAPASFVSNAASFVVEALPPVISGLSPDVIASGGSELTLTVNGSNFAPSAQVLWDGQPLATQFVSASQLTAQVPAELITNGQTVGVAVRNQLPDERISAAVPLTVQLGGRQIYLPMLVR